MRVRAMFVALLVSVVGGLVVVAPATPAQAAPGGGVCFPVYDLDRRVTRWLCFEVVRSVKPRPDPCLCPDWVIEILTDRVLPEDLQTRFYDRLAA